MKAILQRVLSASVQANQEVVGSINRGWLVLLGVCEGDNLKDAEYLANKTCRLRAFSDSSNKMNLAVKEIDGEILVVSQFTLYGDCSKGRRPSFKQAAEPKKARELYESFIECLKNENIITAKGSFGDHMDISIEADGPVTLILESPKKVL